MQKKREPSTSSGLVIRSPFAEASKRPHPTIVQALLPPPPPPPPSSPPPPPPPPPPSQPATPAKKVRDVIFCLRRKKIRRNCYCIDQGWNAIRVAVAIIQDTGCILTFVNAGFVALIAIINASVINNFLHFIWFFKNFRQDVVGGPI